MKKSDVQKLAHGLYCVLWKDGSLSFAAVGSTKNGTRWLAPANWIGENRDYPRVATTNHWKRVLEMQLIQIANQRSI